MAAGGTEFEASQSYRIGESTLQVVRGDITRQVVDAIVNAANEALAGGGGVDGAIHTAGGPGIMEECRRIGGCATGDAVVTGAGELPCRWVIHTVGPIWRGGESGEPAILARCYRESLKRAAEVGATSVAFPSISTGVYGYPLALAAPLALASVAQELDELAMDLIRFVLFGDEAYNYFVEAAERL